MSQKFAFHRIATTAAALCAVGLLASSAAAAPTSDVHGLLSEVGCDDHKKKDKDSSLADLGCDGDKKDKDSSLADLGCDGDKKNKDSSLADLGCDGDQNDRDTPIRGAGGDDDQKDTDDC